MDQGDPNEALESLHCSLALGRSLQSNTLIEQLVRIAIFALNLQTLERILSRTPLTEIQQ